MERADTQAGQISAAIASTAAATNFSGVVRVDLPGGDVIEQAFGLADRRFGVPMATDTPMSIASGTKGFTALVVLSLVEAGDLRLDLPVREVLGDDLPTIDDAVTVEHLLAHRSGIGDYLDEEAPGDIADHVMAVPVHQLDSAEAYLAVLDGFPQVFEPGSRFAYNNSGYVVLALIAERVSGVSYAQLVAERVCRPAGLDATAFHRSDSLPSGVATGYVDPEGLRTNALHLPVVGVGDGGLFSTVADVRQFWMALFAGQLVPSAAVVAMTTRQPANPDAAPGADRYGLGFWLPAEGPLVRLEGYDAGVSFVSAHIPESAATFTVISNTSEGAWPMGRAISGLFAPDVASAQ